MQRKSILTSIAMMGALAFSIWGPLDAQNPGQIRYINYDPTGSACASTAIALRTPNGTLYTCQSGVYAVATGGGPSGPSGPTGANGTAANTPAISHTFTGTQEIAYTHNLNTLVPVYDCYDHTTGIGVTPGVNVSTPPTVNITYITASSSTLDCSFGSAGGIGPTGPTGPSGATGPASVGNIYASGGSLGVGPTSYTPTHTFDVYDATATTGHTTFQIRMGAADTLGVFPFQLFAPDGSTSEASINQRGDLALARSLTIGTAGLSMLNNQIFNLSSGQVSWGSSQFAPTVALDFDAAGVLGIENGTQGTTAANYRDLRLRHTTFSGAPPTITSGLGTTPAIAGADQSFKLTIGSGGTANTGLIAFGTAYTTNAPACFAQNEGTTPLHVQVVATVSGVTLNSFALATGLASPFAAAEIVRVGCTGGF